MNDRMINASRLPGCHYNDKRSRDRSNRVGVVGKLQGPRVPGKKNKNNFSVTVGETFNRSADLGL